MYYTQNDSSGSVVPITGNLYRVLRDWGSQGDDSSINLGEVSWNYSFYNTVPWGLSGANQVGIDRESAIQSSQTFTSTTPVGWYLWNVNPASVQQWTNTSDSFQNYGMIMKSPDVGAPSRYWFMSSEGVQDQRPKLVITYTRSATLCYDVDENGIIDIIDLALTVYWQGKRSTDIDWDNYRHLDKNIDNIVDTLDVNNILSRLGESC